ncbi:hypothetical protein M5K25_002679 [Dendrobium thyrsiflorum]|uniref:RING-type domain-containing protein n=1 Tax=Dendrobium thyrsiflorum TaxID=117978 RepID=A0ABD0VMZ6_DENTH
MVVKGTIIGGRQRSEELWVTVTGRTVVSDSGCRDCNKWVTVVEGTLVDRWRRSEGPESTSDSGWEDRIWREMEVDGQWRLSGEKGSLGMKFGETFTGFLHGDQEWFLDNCSHVEYKRLKKVLKACRSLRDSNGNEQEESNDGNDSTGSEQVCQCDICPANDSPEWSKRDALLKNLIRNDNHCEEQDSLLSRFLDRFYKAVQNFPLSTLLSRTPEIGKTAVPKFFCASTCCPSTRKTVECYPENPTRGSRAYSPSTHQSDSATSSPHHTAVTHFSASFVETNRGHYCGRDHPSLSNIRVAAPPYRSSPSLDGRPSIGFSFESVSYDSPLGPTPSHLSQPLASPDLDSASEILVEKRIRKKRSPELETEYIHFVDANDITDNEDFFEDETEAITLGSLHDLNPDLGELEPLNFNALVNPEPNPIKDIPLDKVYLNDINLISKETDLTLSTMELNSEDSNSIITSTGLTSHNSELIVDNSDLDNLELGVTQESFLLDLHPDLSGPESIDLRIITKYDPIEKINILLEDNNLTLNNSEPNLEDEHPKILLESILGVAPLDLHLKECVSPDLTYLNSHCTDLNESISPYLPVASLTVVPAFVLETLPHLLSPIPAGDSLGYPIIVMSHDPSPYRVPDSYILPSISPSFPIKDHLSPSWLTLLDYTTAIGRPSTTLAETSYRNALDSLLSRFLDRFYKAVQNFPLSTLLSRTPEIGKTAVPKFFCASTCCPATRKTVECYPEMVTKTGRTEVVEISTETLAEVSLVLFVMRESMVKSMPILLAIFDIPFFDRQQNGRLGSLTHIACDQKFFDELSKEASDIAGCFSSRVRRLLHFHFYNGLQRYMRRLSHCFSDDQLTSVREVRMLLDYVTMNAVAIRKILKKYDKVHGSVNGRNFKVVMRAKRIELLQSPWLIELGAFYLNCAGSDAGEPGAFFRKFSCDLPDSQPVMTMVLLDSITYEYSLSCPICLDTVFNPYALGCGHLFCKSCVCAAASVLICDGPRSASREAKCPVCREIASLYARLQTLKSLIKSKNCASSALVNSQIASTPTACQHLKNIFNSPKPPHATTFNFRVGNTIPPDLALSLTIHISNDEIKAVFFSSPSSSASGPDGFTFGFYKDC